MGLRLSRSPGLASSWPQPPPPQTQDLVLGPESHVEAEGVEKGGSLSPARPRLPLNFAARTASLPGSPSPPQLYQGERFDFSTRRAKSKMRNKASPGLPIPLLAPVVKGGRESASPQPLPYAHCHPPPRTHACPGTPGGRGLAEDPTPAMQQKVCSSPPPALEKNEAVALGREGATHCQWGQCHFSQVLPA